MNRRQLLIASTGTAALGAAKIRAADKPTPVATREYYELRRYHVRMGPYRRSPLECSQI